MGAVTKRYAQLVNVGQGGNLSGGLACFEGQPEITFGADQWISGCSAVLIKQEGSYGSVVRVVHGDPRLARQE
jgi:hypothetical protein